MQRKGICLLGVATLALGLAACRHDNGIIKYQTPMSNIKEAPRDTTQQDKQAAAQTHTQLAVAYMGQDDLKQAETALHKALGFDDKYVQAHTVLAILYWKIDRLQDADKEFRAAIAIDPSDGDTNNNYGKFLCAQGKRQDAMKHFKRALADPFYKTPAVANTNAGVCLMGFKDYSGAAPYINRALASESEYGPALLAMAELDLDQNKAFEARGYMQRFESSGKATPESLLLGYRIANRLGDKDSATNYSNRLQDQFPDSTQAQSLNGQNHD
ncbi:MAG TPA: type IV pilus biogenesis/stability protein PilW [Rhodanobacteraceae bacterium]|nr:type IV pilus biogenesis/stability protein PilW [Rhodanobacteraceae bacterium]